MITHVTDCLLSFEVAGLNRHTRNTWGGGENWHMERWPNPTHTDCTKLNQREAVKIEYLFTKDLKVSVGSRTCQNTDIL